MNRDVDDMRTGGWFRISSCVTKDKVLEEELQPWLRALCTIRIARPDFFRELVARLLCDDYQYLSKLRDRG